MLAHRLKGALDADHVQLGDEIAARRHPVWHNKTRADVCQRAHGDAEHTSLAHQQSKQEKIQERNKTNQAESAVSDIVKDGPQEVFVSAGTTASAASLQASAVALSR